METDSSQGGTFAYGDGEQPMNSPNPNSAFPKVALALSILSLLTAIFPAAGIVVSCLATIIAVIALVRANKGNGKKNIAVAALVIAMCAEFAAIAVTACTFFIAKGINDDIRERTGGLDIAEAVKALSALAGDNVSMSDEEVSETADRLEAFRERYKKVTGNEPRVTDEDVRKLRKSPDPVQLTVIQSALDAAEDSSENPSAEALEQTMSLLGMIFHGGTLTGGAHYHSNIDTSFSLAPGHVGFEKSSSSTKSSTIIIQDGTDGGSEEGEGANPKEEDIDGIDNIVLEGGENPGE